jgi:hypothetical protein
MIVLVSGQAGVAVVVEGDQLHSFTVDSPNELVLRREADLRYLFGGATDIMELQEVDRHESYELLVRLWKQDRALHLTLILLDPDAESSTRNDAASCLNGFLDTQEVEEFVSNRLYAAQLPSASDIKGALRHAVAAEATRVHSFLHHLRESQPRIRAVREAWDALPVDLFAPDTRQTYESTLKAAGVFRLLTQSVGRTGTSP